MTRCWRRLTQDAIAQRIKAFDDANGGGVGFYKNKGAYHLCRNRPQAVGGS
jgi:hypothetical protein